MTPIQCHIWFFTLVLDFLQDHDKMMTNYLLLLFPFFDSSEKLFVQVLAAQDLLSASFSRNWSIGFRKMVHHIQMWGRLGFETHLDLEKDEAILYFKNCGINM